MHIGNSNRHFTSISRFTSPDAGKSLHWPVYNISVE